VRALDRLTRRAQGERLVERDDFASAQHERPNVVSAELGASAASLAPTACSLDHDRRDGSPRLRASASMTLASPALDSEGSTPVDCADRACARDERGRWNGRACCHEVRPADLQLPKPKRQREQGRRGEARRLPDQPHPSSFAQSSTTTSAIPMSDVQVIGPSCTTTTSLVDARVCAYVDPLRLRARRLVSRCDSGYP